MQQQINSPVKVSPPSAPQSSTEQLTSFLSKLAETPGQTQFAVDYGYREIEGADLIKARYKNWYPDGADVVPCRINDGRKDRSLEPFKLKFPKESWSLRTPYGDQKILIAGRFCPCLTDWLPERHINHFHRRNLGRIEIQLRLPDFRTKFAQANHGFDAAEDTFFTLISHCAIMRYSGRIKPEGLKEIASFVSRKRTTPSAKIHSDFRGRFDDEREHLSWRDNDLLVSLFAPEYDVHHVGYTAANSRYIKNAISPCTLDHFYQSSNPENPEVDKNRIGGLCVDVGRILSLASRAIEADPIQKVWIGFPEIKKYTSEGVSGSRSTRVSPSTSSSSQLRIGVDADAWTRFILKGKVEPYYGFPIVKSSIGLSPSQLWIDCGRENMAQVANLSGFLTWYKSSANGKPIDVEVGQWGSSFIHLEMNLPGGLQSFRSINGSDPTVEKAFKKSLLADKTVTCPIDIPASGNHPGRRVYIRKWDDSQIIVGISVPLMDEIDFCKPLKEAEIRRRILAAVQYFSSLCTSVVGPFGSCPSQDMFIYQPCVEILSSRGGNRGPEYTDNEGVLSQDERAAYGNINHITWQSADFTRAQVPQTGEKVPDLSSKSKEGPRLEVSSRSRQSNPIQRMRAVSRKLHSRRLGKEKIAFSQELATPPAKETIAEVKAQVMPALGEALGEELSRNVPLEKTSPPIQETPKQPRPDHDQSCDASAVKNHSVLATSVQAATEQGLDLPSTSQNFERAHRNSLVAGLAKLGKMGDERDLAILEQVLSCLSDELLTSKNLEKYQVIVARNNVIYGKENIAGRRTSQGVVNSARGIHSPGEVVATSQLRDGRILLDIPALLHEIGHAVTGRIASDLEKEIKKKGMAKAYARQQGFDCDDECDGGILSVLKSDRLTPYERTLKSCLKAFNEESGQFSSTYFHEPHEFLAETFAMFLLKPEELLGKFPKTYECLANSFKKHPIDTKKLASVSSQMFATPPVKTDPSADHWLKTVEELRSNRIAAQRQPESVIFEFDGDAEEVRAVVTHLGIQLNLMRANRTPFNDYEGFVEVTPALIKDPKAFFDEIAGGVGGIIYVPDPQSLGPTSQFMAAFEVFSARHGGLFYLALGGTVRDRSSYTDFMPEQKRIPIRCATMSGAQLTEKVFRLGVDDGYTFQADARVALEGICSSGGTFKDADRLWREVKGTYLSQAASGEARDIISKDCIEGMKYTPPQNPLAILNAWPGGEEVKAWVNNIVAHHRLQRRRVEEGLPVIEASVPTNLVVLGNPGTGKTTISKMVGPIFFYEKIILKPSELYLKASELAGKGPTHALSEFEKGKGGVIVIDELHQLDPNVDPAGLPIIKLLVPLLTDPNWSDTVFIGLGYPGDVLDLLEADQGLRSRLALVRIPDYSPTKLRSIVVDEISKLEYVISDEALDALCARVNRLQRMSPYPGNGRDAVTTLNEVLTTQSARLALLEAGSLTRIEMRSITIGDVVIPPAYSVDEVMSEIEEKLIGNEEIKDFMRTLVMIVANNKSRGVDLAEDIPFGIIIDGPAGTGKSSCAKFLAKLYAALDLLPSDECCETVGGMMVGGFLGNSSAIAVNKAFNSAHGRTIFIDEFSSMASARELSVQAIKALLTQTQRNQGKFLLVVADYPDKIDETLAFDSGLPRRFKARIATEKMSTKNAEVLFRKLASKKYKILSDCKGVITTLLPKLTYLPGFASAGDIETLVESIPRSQAYVAKNQMSTGKGKGGTSFVPGVLSSPILSHALNSLIKDVEKRIGGAQLANNSDEEFKFQTQIASRGKRSQVTASEVSQERLVVALDEVNRRFADVANSDPKKLEALLSDTGSEYYKALATVLGVSLDAAVRAVDRYDLAIEKELAPKIKTKKLKFDYLCPYCGGQNSSSCAYYSASQAVNPETFQYSMKWLLRNSLKKPYEV